jgi:hypothetical protein
VIALVRRLFPRKHVLEARAAAGLQPDPQAALLQVLLREHLPNLPRGAFANLDHGSLDAADNTDARRTTGDGIAVTGGADALGSAAISEVAAGGGASLYPPLDALVRGSNLDRTSRVSTLPISSTGMS